MTQDPGGPSGPGPGALPTVVTCHAPSVLVAGRDCVHPNPPDPQDPGGQERGQAVPGLRSQGPSPLPRRPCPDGILGCAARPSPACPAPSSQAPRRAHILLKVELEWAHRPSFQGAPGSWMRGSLRPAPGTAGAAHWPPSLQASKARASARLSSRSLVPPGTDSGQDVDSSLAPVARCARPAGRGAGQDNQATGEGGDEDEQKPCGASGRGGAGTLPPAQAPFGQLHLGQAVFTQHPHPGDGGQRPLAVWELQHLVLLRVDVEVLGVRADLHLSRQESDPRPQQHSLGHSVPRLPRCAGLPGPTHHIGAPHWGPSSFSKDEWPAARVDSIPSPTWGD